MIYHYTLYALLDEWGRRRDQTQLLPALSNLLLHFFIISCTTCTLYQLSHKQAIVTFTKMPKTALTKQFYITETKTEFDLDQS